MRAAIKIPNPKLDYYPLKGGLDVVTPAIALSPGKCFDAQNYILEITGGYKRTPGFERFDGHPSPSEASYWVLPFTLTGTLAVGNTVTGVTSAATGKILAIVGADLILGRVTGTFNASETLNVGGTPQATTTGLAVENGATLPVDDATYSALAADDRRADIAAVPGSGPIRGLVFLSDTLYAFRDNVGGTAGAIYKQSASGWTSVALGTEIQFTGAVGEIFVGDAITGGTSGATAVVVASLLRSGTWTAAGVGTLVISAVTGTWQNGEAIKVGATTKATTSSLATAITRAPGGYIDGRYAIFTTAGLNRKFWGADGVNTAFAFDGTNYIPIRTGNTIDKPSHAHVHKDHLFLSFGSSLQYSGINTPYFWAASGGSAEIFAGSTISGIQSLSGNQVGASLMIFADDNTFVLYGSSSADFNLVTSTFELGFGEKTIQAIGNDIYGLTNRGVHTVNNTLQYGNFVFNAVTFPIQPIMAAKLGTESASYSSKTFNDYRLFFSDGTGIVVGITAGKVTGILPLNYGKEVHWAQSFTNSAGQEVIFWGATDGFVYQDCVGTSFDGEEIEAWIRLAFNNLQSPQIRKRYVRSVFEVKAEGYATAQVAYDLGYANPDVNSSSLTDMSLVGAGGYWDQVTWDQFVWDAPVVSTPKVTMSGTETNVSFLFYSMTAIDKPLTVQGVTLEFIPRRIARGS